MLVSLRVSYQSYLHAAHRCPQIVLAEVYGECVLVDDAVGTLACDAVRCRDNM